MRSQFPDEAGGDFREQRMLPRTVTPLGVIDCEVIARLSNLDPDVAKVLITCFAECIKALAWPLTVLILVFACRKPLAELIGRMRRISATWFKAEFSEQLKQVADIEVLVPLQKVNVELPVPSASREFPTSASREVEQLATTEYVNPELECPPATDPMEAVRFIASVAPVAAIRKAWDDLDRAIMAAAKRLEARPPKSFKARAKLLADRGFLDPEVLGLLDRLRTLRDEAIHAREGELDTNHAVNYARLAYHVVRRLLDIADISP